MINKENLKINTEINGEEKNTPNHTVRINKFLSEAGVLSRRKADEAVSAGEVMVNGIPAELGTVVGEGDTVTWRGEVVERKIGARLALNVSSS